MLEWLVVAKEEAFIASSLFGVGSNVLTLLVYLTLPIW
jgi:hypothetical protein